MADRAASAASIKAGIGAGPVAIKVIRFEIDPEIKLRRSVTSDGAASNGYLSPSTVFESEGGIIRGTGYVDPSDPIIAQMLSSFGVNYTGTQFDYSVGTFVFDTVSGSPGARVGYTFSVASTEAKIFPLHIGGETNDGGMIEIAFEIHTQFGLAWGTALT